MARKFDLNHALHAVQALHSSECIDVKRSLQQVAAFATFVMSAMSGPQAMSVVSTVPNGKSDPPADGKLSQEHQSEPLRGDDPDAAAAAVNELLLKLLATSTCGLVHCVAPDLKVHCCLPK